MRTAGVAPLPGNRPALEAEGERLERELGAARHPQARRLLAIERRRVVIELDRLRSSGS